MISLLIILVHCLLANSKSGMDGEGELMWTVRGSGKDLVNVVHGRNHCCETWSSAREKEGGIFEDLSSKLER